MKKRTRIGEERGRDVHVVIETKAAKRLGSDNICPKSMNGIQKWLARKIIFKTNTYARENLSS